MATAKKGARSTKTAHVLNLLAPNGEKDPVPQTEAPAEAPASLDGEAATIQDASAVPAPRTLTPPVLEVARTNDAQISAQIRDALESEFLPDLEGSPAPQPVSEAVSEPEPTPEPVPEAAPEPEPAPEPVPEAAPEPEPAPEPVPEAAPEPEQIGRAHV